MADKKFLDDFEEYEVSDDHHPSRFGYFLKWIFFILILFANGALILRVCMAEDPKAVKSLAVNDKLREAYSDSDELKIYTQTVFDMYTSDGIYYSTGLFYCPEAAQLQVSVRYNVRTADTVMVGTVDNFAFVEELSKINFYPISRIAGEVFREYSRTTVSLSADEMRNGRYFAFRLADDNGNYYTPSSVDRFSRILYVYNKLTFDGVPAEGTNFYVEIYPLISGLPDYDTLLGRMKVLSVDRTLDEYELSGSLKKELSSE